MFSKFATRREFLNCGKLSLLFFLNSCSNLPNKLKIALQSSFYPESFIDTIPKDWNQEKINFENNRLQKNRNTIFNLLDKLLQELKKNKSESLPQFKNSLLVANFENIQQSFSKEI